MPYGDGIPRERSFSLTDFNTFEQCSFRFFVFHHLQRKYELSDSSPGVALGTLLDESIKLFHESRAYGCDESYIGNIVKGALNKIKDKVAKAGINSFHGKHLEYLKDDLVEKAIRIFQSYYLALNKRIKPSIGKVNFGEVILEGEDGKIKLWGAPDAYELGDDGVVEVVDYKSREDIENVGNNLDMELMPKIYILLSARELRERGYDKARFVVRLWQDPLNDSYYEEFSLLDAESFGEFFKTKAEKILSTKELSFCEKDWCVVCQSPLRDDFLRQLKKIGLAIS